MNLKFFLLLSFLNIYISIAFYNIGMKFFPCVQKVVLEGPVSQIFFQLGPDFYFCQKSGDVLSFFFNINFIKLELFPY